MRGYKATYNMKCNDFKYEVGGTYEIEGKLEMCRNGFHFCQNQQDVLCYYGYGKNFVLLEVEALGKVLTHGDKSVTNKIRILRVVPREEWEFLEEGHVIHWGRVPYENWRKYDDDFKLIHFKSSQGYQEWMEYNENGNIIHCKNSNGDEEWIEYAEGGEEIDVVHKKDSEGYEEWIGYDEYGYVKWKKNSNGAEYY